MREFQRIKRGDLKEGVKRVGYRVVEDYTEHQKMLKKHKLKKKRK